MDDRLAGDETERLRERLSRAGLLADVTPMPYPAPDPAAVARASKRAARGRSISSMIIEDRG